MEVAAAIRWQWQGGSDKKNGGIKEVNGCCVKVAGMRAGSSENKREVVAVNLRQDGRQAHFLCGTCSLLV